LGLGEQTPVV
jgi:hypothetical protein